MLDDELKLGATKRNFFSKGLKVDDDVAVRVSDEGGERERRLCSLIWKEEDGCQLSVI